MLGRWLKTTFVVGAEAVLGEHAGELVDFFIGGSGEPVELVEKSLIFICELCYLAPELHLIGLVLAYLGL